MAVYRYRPYGKVSWVVEKRFLWFFWEYIALETHIGDCQERINFIIANTAERKKYRKISNRIIKERKKKYPPVIYP